jgi:hypothetical protein
MDTFAPSGNVCRVLLRIITKAITITVRIKTIIIMVLLNASNVNCAMELPFGVGEATGMVIV